mgnify:CR=1 FL=1
MKKETIAIHSGMESDGTHGDVVPPIHKSTIFKHRKGKEGAAGYNYTRAGNPNRTQLEQQLAALESGSDAAAFSSGVAASSAVFQALEPGDHVLAPEDVYHGTRELLNELMRRWGLEINFVDMTDVGAVDRAMQDNTKLIWIESPSNPMLYITDIGSVCEMAGDETEVCVDNTWPTPVNQRPLEFGADLVVHSTTKYLGGHSDVLGGAVIAATSSNLYERIESIQSMAGAVPSPSNCWLLSRSIRTLPYRVRAHNENARQLAEFLEAHSKIEEVYYPGLKSHDSYELARRQMEGPGGMISFLVDGTEEEAKEVIWQSQLITPATSLGGVESTWEHRLSSEGEGSQTPGNMIRISVGLEHVDDLASDLERALGVLD